jgi:nitroreductase
MDSLTAIHTRQSVKKVKPDPLARELIEKLLAAANAAPNHHKVRPWRFVVMSGDGRNKLADAMAASFKAKFPDVAAEAVEKERAKPFRAPVVVAVAVDKPTESKVDELENICAAAAACQNILLAAHALGLGAIWRTGDAVRDPLVKMALGFEADQHLIGFIYVGYPEAALEPKERPGFEERTVWFER